MRILVVEDDHKVANSIKKGLEQESFATDVVYDGKEAMDYIEATAYDLIVLDRMLPGMDGIEICRQVRKRNLHMPILMLTARGLVEDRVDGLDSGADDYVVKPFSFSELVARIRALLRRNPSVDQTILKVSNLELNPQTFTVIRQGKAIQLSGKEFALLEYLMRHPNQIITKDRIIEHVWNYDADVLPNSVEVYMRRLRQKVDQPFSKQLLHTLRGFGYKIGEDR